MEKDNDVQLIHDVLSGDDEAFSVLVEKYQKTVHALVWRKVGDFHDAEEITQDTFLRAYKGLSTLKNPNLFAGWLYVIANRLCINWLKKQKPVTQSLEDTSLTEVNNAAYTHYESQQRETQANEHRHNTVKRLLEKLPESERTVVTLYYLSEMTTKEIGKFLGVSVNTITSRLQRGRKRLQEQAHLVQEILGSVQIPTRLIENIMRQIADITPTPAPTTKPIIPWIAFGTAILLIALLLGTSNHLLIHFQKPYSFEAIAEPTIVIFDTAILLNIDTKPDLRNQVGQDDTVDNNISTPMNTAETRNTTQRPNQDLVLTQEQQQKNIEICTQKLLAIGKAIQTYQKDNEYLPEWLSDLHPKYLPDASILICPADTHGGIAPYTINIDPKMSVSYGYQFHPEYRTNRNTVRLLYGDVIPLVRCRHHENTDFECLNLSFDLKVYTSTATWEEAPEDMYDSPAAAISAFEEILQQYPKEDFSELYAKLNQLYAKVENEPLTNTLTPHKQNTDPFQPSIGKPVPDFSATDLDGNPISLQDYRGKVVLLDFWAVWSNPSTAKMPNVKRIYDTYKDKGFDIIGVNLDTEKVRLRNYINDNDIQWRQIFDFDIENTQNSIARQYRIRAIPALWIIDRQGNLITHTAKVADLEKHLTAILKDTFEIE